MSMRAQLLYLVIFNSTLKPSAPTADEDDYEHASILLYTSQAQAVSRDTMLRQVGLAKALINFSELFTPEAGCDNVHSQRKRMIMFSPEPNFWMHACIQLPTLVRQTSRTSAKGKGKEPVAEILDHLDNNIHDSELCLHLRSSYEAFRLKHGTFDEILNSEGSGELEARLENYFNVWALQWDPGAPVNLAWHLGIPLHPGHQRLKPLVEKLLDDIPCTLTPFILYHNPPSLVHPFNNSSSSPLIQPALLHHLFSMSSLIPQSSPDQSNPSVSFTASTPISYSSSALLANQINPPSPTLTMRASHRTSHSLPNSTSARPLSQFGETMAAPFIATSLYLSTAANPKKWGWPGYLSMKRNGLDAPLSPTMALSNEGIQKASAASAVQETVPAHGRISDQHQTKPTPTSAFLSTPTPEEDPKTPVNQSHEVVEDALKDAMIVNWSPLIEKEDEDFQYPPLPPSPPPPFHFSKLRIRMPLEENSLRTKECCAYYVQGYGFTFAMLTSEDGEDECIVNSDRRLQLEGRVGETLFAMQAVLDDHMPSISDVLQPVSSVASKGIILEKFTEIEIEARSEIMSAAPHLPRSLSTTTVIAPLGTTYLNDPHLIAVEEAFARYPWISEIISRSTANRWFAARRQMQSAPTPNSSTTNNPRVNMNKSVFIEVGNAQASLVEVDTELGGLMRLQL